MPALLSDTKVLQVQATASVAVAAMRSGLLIATARRLAVTEEGRSWAWRALTTTAAVGTSAVGSCDRSPAPGTPLVAHHLPAVAGCPRPWGAANFAAAAQDPSGHDIAQKVAAASQGEVGRELVEAVARLVPQAVPSVAKAAAEARISNAALLDALSVAAVQAMPSLSPSDICSIVESFSDVGCYSTQFKDATADVVLARLDEFNGDMLGNLMRAFGDMGYIDSELFEGVVEHVGQSPDKFSAKNIAHMVHAMSRCGFCHPDLVTMVETAAGTLLKETGAGRGHALASILEAYSHVGCSSPDVVDQLVARAAEAASSFDAACLAKVVTAAIKLGYSDEELLLPLLDAMAAKLHEISPKAIVELVGALGDLGYEHQPLLTALTERVVPGRLHEFPLDHLADLVEPLNKLGYYNRDFQALLKQASTERQGDKAARAAAA